MENRIGAEQARINQGVRTGALTRPEYDRLEARLQRIQAQRNTALRRNGGRLTPSAAARLNAEENQFSSSISG